MGTLVRTKILFIFISLEKLIHSHKKYSKNTFSGGNSRSGNTSAHATTRESPQLKVTGLASTLEKFRRRLFSYVSSLHCTATVFLSWNGGRQIKGVIHESYFWVIIRFMTRQRQKSAT